MGVQRLMHLLGREHPGKQADTEVVRKPGP